jgi:CBS domain-containing protein
MAVKDLEDLNKLSMLRSNLDATSIEEVLSTDFPKVRSDSRTADALSEMSHSGYQDIPVIDNGEYKGMISFSTFLRRRDISLDTKVGLLIRRLPTLNADTELTKIAEYMVGTDSRQLAVLNEKKVIGVVSRRNLIDVASRVRSIGDIKVWEIMTTPMECIDQDLNIGEAVKIMKVSNIRTVPTTDKTGKITGIIGMKEIISNYWSGSDPLDSSGWASKPIGPISKHDVMTADWDMDLKKITEIMRDKNVSTLPVIDDGEGIGIITEYDIIELLSACRERKALFVQISGLEKQDQANAETMYRDISTKLGDICALCRPETLSIRVSKYENEGKTVFSLSGKVHYEDKCVNAKAANENIIQANIELIDKLTIAVIECEESKAPLKRPYRSN